MTLILYALQGRQLFIVGLVHLTYQIHSCYCYYLVRISLSLCFPVLGAISPSELGRTLTHEHLSMNFEHFYRKPPEALVEHFQTTTTLKNIGYIRQYPYSSKNNLKLDDKEAQDAVLDDVLAYKEFGGGQYLKSAIKCNMFNFNNEIMVNILISYSSPVFEWLSF